MIDLMLKSINTYEQHILIVANKYSEDRNYENAQIAFQAIIAGTLAVIAKILLYYIEEKMK
jgi:hypothetical protein